MEKNMEHEMETGGILAFEIKLPCLEASRKWVGV